MTRIILVSAALAFLSFSAIAWLFELGKPGEAIRAQIGILYTESNAAP